MNKKGYDGSMLWWAFNIMITIIMVALITMVVTSILDKSLELEDLKFYPLSQRVLYSDTCFIVIEPRPYPGIIDKSKFTQSQLRNCFAENDRPIGIKLTLTDQFDQSIIYYNQEAFEDIAPLMFGQRFEYKQKRYYVLVEDDGIRIPANLLVEATWQI